MGPGFQPTRIFHMARGILEGIETMPSLHITQAIAEVAVVKDPHELMTLQAKLADEAVLAFAKQESTEMYSSHTLQAHFMLGATMLSEVATKPARER